MTTIRDLIDAAQDLAAIQRRCSEIATGTGIAELINNSIPWQSWPHEPVPWPGALSTERYRGGGCST